jgi:hypothetical protein
MTTCKDGGDLASHPGYYFALEIIDNGELRFAKEAGIRIS